jgi:tetratricopeptide (TPR) repeat protein
METISEQDPTVTDIAGSDSGTMRNLVWGREIPIRNPHFTGRAREIEELRQRLTAGSPAVIGQPAMPLYGLGGVGKTEIAAEYAHLYRDHYSLCWWVRCEREALIVNSLLSLGRVLQIPDFRVEERDYSVGLVIDALNRGEPYANWLLIFDNATDASMIARYIPQGKGHVIITSRDRHWRGALRVDGIEVAEFNPAETVEFMRRRVPALAEVGAESGMTAREQTAENERRVADATELAKELDNLPLAAEHAAAYLAETGTSTREYLALYRNNAHKLLATDVDISYPHAVAATWSVSRGLISPEADALFKLMSFFAPEPIYEELLRPPGAAAFLTLPAPLDRVVADPVEFRRARRKLAQISLIKSNPARNVLQMHRVVRAVTQSQIIRENPQEAAQFRAAAHSLLAASDPNTPDRDDSGEAYERSRQHLVPSGALESPDPLVRRLIRNQVRRLHRRGGFQESLSLGQLALETWQQKFGHEDRDTLALAVEVGFALRRLGKIEEALRLDAETKESLQRLYGEEDPAYLTCVRGYGLDLNKRGIYAEALESNLSMLPLYERVYEPGNLDTLHLRNNIAISLRCLGRFTEALEYDEQTLAERERILGTNDTATLTSRFAVARDKRRLGHYDDALDDIRAVSETLEQKDEPWNQFRLMVGVDLATALRRCGYYPEAAELGEDIIGRYHRMLGKQDRETLWAATLLMNVRRTNDDLAGAQELGEEAVAGWQKQVRPGHPNTVAAEANLAIVLRERGNPEGARQMDERALAAFIEIFGEAHPSPIVLMTNLASDLAIIGEVRQARELGEKALNISRDVRGRGHHATLAVAANLALDRRADGDPGEAQVLYEETLDRLRDVLGEAHPETKRAAQRGRMNLDIEPMHT